MARPRTITISGVILLFFLLCITSPVLAGEKYSSGEPDISAGIGGSNQLHIGEQSDVTVSLTNAGVVDMKFIDDGTITPDYLPTTALSLTALLGAGDSPVTITADPQILGDIKAGSVTQATFPVTVPESAHPGDYDLSLTLTYKYMDQATQTGIDAIQYSFKEQTETLTIPVTIRPVVRLEIVSVDSGDLNVGGEGHIIINVKNTGKETGKETVFTLEPVGTNPIVPYQDSIYAGTFDVGETTTLSYKVSVASNADPSIQYPLKLSATYTDYQGLQAETEQKDLSAGFRQKITFEVVSQPDAISSGDKGIIDVEYKNTGADTVYNAQAGVNIVDPFTSEDDQSYLGTVQPGEIATARFKLNVNSGTTPKQYALDSEIRYTDVNLTQYVTDPIKVPVNVTDSSATALVIPGIIIILLLIGGGYFYYRRTQQS